MRIHWPRQFGIWLDVLRKAAAEGDPQAKLKLRYVAEALELLRNLTEPPTREAETADLRLVRQSRKYEVWRVSHPYDPDIAVRLICWFPPDSKTVVVALFVGDKARTGDIWYNSVASQAIGIIEQWKREVGYDREEED